MSADPEALPLRGSVLELSSLADGRIRVTFRRLAAIYYVNPGLAGREGLLEALERSLRTGEVLELKYALADKSLRALAS